MHGSVINVPTNMNQIQSILPRLPHDGPTIDVFFKWHFEYKSLYMLGNVRANMTMVVFMRFNWNIIIERFECYYSSSIGKFVCFVYEFKSSNSYLL
jgi:hypothetical protein